MSAFPAVAEVASNLLLQRQTELLQAFGAAKPEQWDATLGAKVHLAHPVAIQICWDGARAYRLDRNTLGAAMFLGNLGVWLAARIGNLYEQAESAYQFAAALVAAEKRATAFDQMQSALHLYLESLCFAQPLECFKQVADLSRSRRWVGRN
jgi:hypothetical protein